MELRGFVYRGGGPGGGKGPEGGKSGVPSKASDKQKTLEKSGGARKELQTESLNAGKKEVSPLQNIPGITPEKLETARKYLKEAMALLKKSFEGKKLPAKMVIDFSDIDKYLPLMIKESRLHSTVESPSKAKGYFQMREIAVNDVKRKIKEANDAATKARKTEDIITIQESPTSEVNQCVYGILCYHLCQDYYAKLPVFAKLKPEEQKVIGFMIYNKGYTHVKGLWEATEASSLADFESKLSVELAQQLGVSVGSAKPVLDENYNVTYKETPVIGKYKELLRKDPDKLLDKKFTVNGMATTLKIGQVGEVLRYPKVIDAITVLNKTKGVAPQAVGAAEVAPQKGSSSSLARKDLEEEVATPPGTAPAVVPAQPNAAPAKSTTLAPEKLQIGLNGELIFPWDREETAHMPVSSRASAHARQSAPTVAPTPASSPSPSPVSSPSSTPASAVPTHPSSAPISAPAPVLPTDYERIEVITPTRGLWSIADTLGKEYAQKREPSFLNYNDDYNFRKSARERLIDIILIYNFTVNDEFEDYMDAYNKGVDEDNPIPFKKNTRVFIPKTDYVKMNFKKGQEEDAAEAEEARQRANAIKVAMEEASAIRPQVVHRFPTTPSPTPQQASQPSTTPSPTPQQASQPSTTPSPVPPSTPQPPSVPQLSPEYKESFIGRTLNNALSEVARAAYLAQKKEMAEKMRKTRIPLYADEALEAAGNAILQNKYGYNGDTMAIKRKPDLYYPKEKRKETRYIILHSTAGDTGGQGGSGTIEAHGAHYVIDNNGGIHYVIDRDYWIDHAGTMSDRESKALWNGDPDVSQHSIGIEVAANAGKEWNDRQYEAIKRLVHWLGAEYNIPAKNVLAHRQVSSTKFKTRSRKADPYGLNWGKLDLPDNSQLIDLDVVTGALDPNLDEIRKNMKTSVGGWEGVEEKDIKGLVASAELSNSPEIKEIVRKIVAARSKIIPHTVKEGEYVATIARRYRVTIKEVMDFNNLPNANLSVGQILQIPVSSVSEFYANQTTPAPQPTSRRSPTSQRGRAQAQTRQRGHSATPAPKRGHSKTPAPQRGRGTASKRNQSPASQSRAPKQLPKRSNTTALGPRRKRH